jgi:hypothetical protein
MLTVACEMHNTIPAASALSTRLLSSITAVGQNLLLPPCYSGETLTAVPWKSCGGLPTRFHAT